MNRLEFCCVKRYLPDWRINCEWFAMRVIHEQVVEPGVRISAKRSAVDCVDLAHRIRRAYKALQKDPLPFLSGDQRLLNDWIVTDWKWQGSDKVELKKAREHFFLQNFREQADKILTAAHLYSDRNVEDVMLMVLDRGCIPDDNARDLRVGDDDHCGLEAALNLVTECIVWMVLQRYPDMPAYWKAAIDSDRDFSQTPHDLTVECSLHEQLRYDHTLGLSDCFLSDCCKILRICGNELGIMHERQSGELMDWIPSLYERYLYSFVLSTNAKLESLLGSVDDRRRRYRCERTIITGGHATARRNSTNDWTLGKTDAEQGELIKAAMQAVPGQRQFDLDAKAQIEAHRVSKVAEAAKVAHNNVKRTLLSAKRFETIDIARDQESIGALSLPQLRVQVQYWQHQAKHVWQGIASERWRVLLGRSKEGFHMGTQPTLRATEAREKETARYRAIVEAVVFHHRVVMTNSMKLELDRLRKPEVA
jgi:hypothetical protein